LVSQSVAVMRHARMLAPPRRVPVRLPAPVVVAPPPRVSAPPPRPSAPVIRRPAPPPDVRPPALIFTLRRPAIVLALRDSVFALVPRWPSVTLADMARPVPADAVAAASSLAATLRRSGVALSAVLSRAVFGLKLAAAALVAGVVVLAIMNNRGVAPAASGGYELASLGSINETVVFRRPSLFHAAGDDEESVGQQPEQPLSYYQRAIQTIRFLNPIPRIALASAVPDTPAVVKVHGFTVFAPKDSTESDVSQSILRRRTPSGGPMDEIDDYLWEVYQRQPVKRDSSGDFSWKDPAAAKRMGLSLADYVIGGMDPKFRERLYRAGRAMDADGIRWSMLSAFRDDYRQRLAEGFKASTGNSLHGGSRRTGGYGYGRAIDITSAEGWGDAESVWKWLDVNGSKYGLHRPMPSADPAHIQQAGDGGRKVASGGGRASKYKRKIRVARAGK
jgi:hypothetical protein